jgi:hypothetical protein
MEEANRFGGLFFLLQACKDLQNAKATFWLSNGRRFRTPQRRGNGSHVAPRWPDQDPAIQRLSHL